MTLHYQEHLEKALKLRTEKDAKGEFIPPQLTTEYLADHFSVSRQYIESRLRKKEPVA